MKDYRAKDETRELELEERRESKNLKLADPFCWPRCFSSRLDWQVPRECLLELEMGLTV